MNEQRRIIFKQINEVLMLHPVVTKTKIEVLVNVKKDPEIKLKSVTQFGLYGISYYLILIFVLFMWEHHKRLELLTVTQLAKM